MKKNYSPKSLDQVVFDELKRFFRSCPEVVNFLNKEELTVLAYYFAGDKPMPKFCQDPEAWCDYFHRMEEDLGREKLVRRRDRWEGAMKKLRARHNLLIRELAGSGTTPSVAFLPWHKFPRGGIRVR